MDLILFLVLFAVTFAFTLLLNYFRRLLVNPDRTEYKREELTQPHQYILGEWYRFTHPQSTTTYIFFAVGALLGLALAYMGGIFGKHDENFIFNSALFPTLIFFTWPLFRGQMKKLTENQTALVKTILEGLFIKDTAFFVGLTSAVVAQITTVLFTTNNMPFVWVLINSILGLVLALIKMYRTEKESSEPATEQSSEETTISEE